MAEKTKFQYAKSPTGALSGASFIQQTEDAINDIGGKLVEYNAISEETKRKAEQAISTSETALNTANQALTQSAQAIETANTAKAQSDSAVTESRAAKEAAEAAQLDAEESARDAESSRQAAEDANEAAQAAAQRAQTAQDTAETAQENAYAARQAASQAQESATRAEANALLAQSQAAESAAAAEALADGVVRYDSSQTLNASQKTQARTNIGAADASDTYTKADAANTFLKKTDNAVSASKLQTSRRISATGDATWSVGFNGMQDESGTLTLSASGATAGSYGPSAAATLAFGGSFNVPYVTVDAKGRVTSVKSIALKMPSAQTDVTGNAETATKLETARKITFTGGATGSFTFDGSADRSCALTLDLMTGATSSAAGAAGAVPAPAAGYQGRFLRGDGTWQTPTDNKVSQTSSTANGKYPILLKASTATSNATAGALFDADVSINPSTGTVYFRKISGKNTATLWVDAAKAGGSILESEDNSTGGEFTPFIRFKSTNGVFVLNGHQDGFLISYLTDENVEAGSNTVTESLEFTEAGVLVSTGGFKGSLSGNASTASRWSSSRTLTLAGDLTGSVSFNGSANFTLTATIANGSVVTAMIADDAITAAKLATNSVTADAIAANAVGASELANNAVDAAAIASGAVTFAKIASGDIATQSEAEAGTANNCLMTPQRVKQAITANDPGVLQAFLDFADDNNIS